MQLEVGFYYYLDPLKLLQLYDSHGSAQRNGRAAYEHYFEDLCLEAIKNEAVKFVTTEFFTNRVSIDAAMKAAVSETIFLAGANISGFNLLSVDVPYR